MSLYCGRASHCVLHLFTAFVICGADENMVEALNSYSTATVYECQEEAKESGKKRTNQLPARCKRAGFPEFVNA
jgi:hypothetical protein